MNHLRVCHLLTLITLTIILTVVKPIGANASGTLLCETVFTDLKPFQFESFEGTFTEMNPAYGDWQTHQIGTHDLLTVNRTEEIVELKGSLDDLRTSSSIFEMATPSLSGPYKSRRFTLGNKGRGMVINIETSERDLDIDIRLSGLTRQDAKGLIPTEKFSAGATIRSTGGRQKIFIPWENFRMAHEVRNGWNKNHAPSEIYPSRHGSDDIHAPPSPVVTYQVGDSFYPAAFETQALSIRVKRSDRSKAGSRVFNVRLNGPIYRDFDLNWAAQSVELAVNTALRINKARMWDETFGIALASTPELYAAQLNNPEAQNYAFDTIARGQAFIEQELAKHGATLREIGEKITDDIFFTDPAAVHEINPVFKPIFKASRRIPALPVENGAFALRHGRWTHVAQYLAAMYKLDPSSREYRDMNNFFTLGFGGPFNVQWRVVWNIFMDAPGDTSPNMVGWWTREFKRRGIPLG